MPVQRVISKGKVPVKIYTDDIEHQAMEQLYNLSQMSFVHSHIAVMPDVHFGRGATIGSVIPCKGAIIPAAVGVDIGCGMNAMRLSIMADQLPDSLRGARSAIEKRIAFIHRCSPDCGRARCRGTITACRGTAIE